MNRSIIYVVPVCLFVLASQTGCNRTARLPSSAIPDLMIGLEVEQQQIQSHGDTLTINYEMINTTSNPLYVELGRNMPYRQIEGITLSLRFLVEPEPGRLYNFFEVPDIRRIDPRSSFKNSITIITPPSYSDHFHGTISPLRLNPGELRVQIIAGYGTSSFSIAHSTRLLQDFSAWQRIAASPIVTLTVQ